MSTDARNKIRAATIGAKKNFRSEVVEYNGVEVEIRQPTVRARKTLYNECRDKDGNVDPMEFLVWCVVHCTYVPGTDDLVFEVGDHEAMLDQPAGSFVDQFGEKASELFNAAEKN